MADATGFYFNTDFSLSGLRNFFLYQLKFSAGRGYLYCFHQRHFLSPEIDFQISM
jgi:hypothetical protein